MVCNYYVVLATHFNKIIVSRGESSTNNGKIERGLKSHLELAVKVHLTPKFFSAEMKLCNIHIKNLIILSVSGNFEGFKN